MQVKSFLRMAHLALNLLKRSSTVLLLMNMEFVILEVQMEEFMFGIRNKTWD